MSENYLAIGDIHGRFDLLELLLKKIHDAGIYEAGGYKLVFLGDMVDRGPDSFKVVDRIKSLCDNGKAIALRGNHEDMMLDYYGKKRVDHYDIWIWNGGGKTVISYGRETKLYGNAAFFAAFGHSGHASWMRSLPYYYETDKIWFSHAPIPRAEFRKRRELDYRMDVDALTWTYIPNIKEGTWELNHGKLAVCGHVHDLFRNNVLPRYYDHIFYADTGSGCGPAGRLTAVVVTDGKMESFIQAAPEELPREGNAPKEFPHESPQAD